MSQMKFAPIMAYALFNFVFFTALLLPICTVSQNNKCMQIDAEGSGACGYNSVCRLQNGNPICECPQGYSFLDPSNPLSDCTSKFLPICGEEDDHNRSPEDMHEIVMVRDVDWPLSDFEQIRPSTANVCRNACLNDCLCGVSIYRNNSCWKKKLPLSNGRVDTSLNSQVFLKFRKRHIPPPSPDYPINNNKRKKAGER